MNIVDIIIVYELWKENFYENYAKVTLVININWIMSLCDAVMLMNNYFWD